MKSVKINKNKLLTQVDRGFRVWVQGLDCRDASCRELRDWGIMDCLAQELVDFGFGTFVFRRGGGRGLGYRCSTCNTKLRLSTLPRKH